MASSCEKRLLFTLHIACHAKSRKKDLQRMLESLKDKIGVSASKTYFQAKNDFTLFLAL